jgi:ubiquinone/menaquinone biosynthesis C-methylase UbiE
MGSQTEETLSNEYHRTAERESSLKENAIEYFRTKSRIYNERYSVRASGDLLWVRHNAIVEFARKWHLPPGSRVMDLGCGPGLLTRDLASLGYSGVGLDSSPSMIELSVYQAQAGGRSDSWKYELGDVEAVPFPDASFDAAICSGVIDYLPTDEKLIAEAARILKPGGRFIICFTNKFGYTVSLSKPIYWLKRIPVIRHFGSWLRSALVGGKEGAMEFDFIPRKQRPATVREVMRRNGFHLEEDRFVHFSLLPAPFCTLTSKLSFGIEEKLSILDRTPLRILGSCYIVSAYLKNS